MALGPFAGGFGQGLGLGARLGLQGMEDLRLREREERAAQLADRKMGIDALEGFTKIASAKGISPQLRKVIMGNYLTHISQFTGKPIDPGIQEALLKGSDDDRLMISDALTELMGADVGMGAMKLMDAMGSDLQSVMPLVAKGLELKQGREDRAQESRWIEGARLGQVPAPMAPTPRPSMLGPTQYKAEIEAAAKKYGFPPELIEAQIGVESGGNPRAVSEAGAQGLMQIMPETGRGLGLAPEQAMDPKRNVETGVRYLRQLYDQFGGNIEKALTAYHSGPGNVEAGTLGPKGKAYAPQVLGSFKQRTGIDLSQSNAQLATLQQQIDILQQAPPGLKGVKEQLDRLTKQRDDIQQRQQFAITEGRQQQAEQRSERGEQRAERIEARQERESILNPAVEAARVRIAQAEGQARADVVEANLRYTPQQQKQLASLNETLTSAEVLMDIPDAQIDKWVGILKNPLQRARQAVNPDPEFLAFQNTIDQLKASLLFSREEGGGGALTPTEYGALEAFLPTGRETGGTAQIRVKLQQLQQRLGSKLQTIEGLGRAKPGEAGDILRRQREQARQMRRRGPVEVIPGTTVEEIP